MKSLFAFCYCMFLFGTSYSQQTVGTLTNEPSTSEGYILYPPRKYHITYLINNEGKKVNEWVEAKGNRVENVKLLENGILVRAVNREHSFYKSFAGDFSSLEMVDWDGNVVWNFEYADNTHIMHHDFVPIKQDDGTYHFLVSTWDVVDATTMITEGRNPSAVGGSNNFILLERILEIEPTLPSGGNIVWEWAAIDHLIQEDYASQKNYISNGVINNSQLLHVNYFKNTSSMSSSDWMHVSGLDYNKKLDQILIANHGLNEVLIIDHSTTSTEAASHTGGTYGKGGDILYRWGNPATYKAGGNNDKILYSVHNPHWVPDTLTYGGSIMAFNNGFTAPSKIEVFSPTETAAGVYTVPSPGSPFGPANSKYTYQNGSDFFSANMGSAQRLPNGNLLINEAVKGTFFEIDPSEKIVWKYIAPIISSGPMDYNVDISTIPTTPGGDQENEVFKIYKYSSSYAGFVGKDLTPGDFIELNNPILNSVESNLSDVLIYPNPSTNVINIVCDSQYHINIYSAYGQLKMNGEYNDNAQINISTLATGIYYVEIKSGTSTTVQKIIKK